MLRAITIELKHANKVVGEYHRHSRPTVGAKFCIGVIDESETLWGVAIIGRPIARSLDDGYTAEVLRVCVLPDAPKGCNSFLYARAWRAWNAMGGTRIVTYTLQSESGASLRGAGWQPIDIGSSGQWNGTRKREEREIYDLKKYRWQKSIEGGKLPHPKQFRLVEEKHQPSLFAEEM